MDTPSRGSCPTFRAPRRRPIRISSTVGASRAARPARGGSRTTAPATARRRSTPERARSTPLVVNVDGGPTGAVFAGVAGNFLVATTASATLAPASFIFDSEDGMIRAWRGGSTAGLVTAHGARRRDLQGPGDRTADARPPLALRGRFPQRRRRRLRRLVDERHAAGLVHRSRASRGLCTVRDPDDRHARLRLVREAGRRRG